MPATRLSSASWIAALCELIGLDFSAGKMSFQYGAEASKPIMRPIGDFARPGGRVRQDLGSRTRHGGGFPRLPQQVRPSTPRRVVCSGSTRWRGRANNGSGAAGAASNSGGNGSAQPSGAQSTNGGGVLRRRAEILDRLARPLFASTYSVGWCSIGSPPRIQEMVRQTSLLNVQRQNETVSVMLRVILDLTAYQFLKSHGHQNVPKDLDKRIKGCDQGNRSTCF